MSQQSDPAKKVLRYGRYEIPVDRNGEPVELGRGGMGVTYKALDSKLDRLVVLKVVSNALHHNAQARQKFLREARLLAKLSHPNIAAVFDIGEQDGTDYYVMEYIEGEDLGARVHAMGAVPVGLALEITRQASAALAAAWKHGLIHRDIKPANLMLAKSDGVVKVKLIDFGLAKAVGAAAQDMTRITLTGEMAGYSPAFASPEQIEGMEVDTRSDLYSLGVTMWYLMAGKPPFSGTSRRQVENAHINQAPPVHLIEKSIPQPVVKMLQHMLEKDPADRPENPEVLEEMLNELVESTEVKAAYDTLAFAGEDAPLKPPRGIKTRATKTVRPGAPPAHTTQPSRMNPLYIAGPAVGILGVALALIFSRSTPTEIPAKPVVLVVTPTPEPIAAGRAPGATDAEFVNTLGMKFLPIPGTRVMFSIWETRVQDYEAFVKANPNYDAGAGWMDPYFPQTPLHPVVFVCYDDALEFCKWLTEKERKEGKILPTQSYRLPTDDEWSAASGLPSEAGDSPDLRDGRNKAHYPWTSTKWPPTGKAGNYADSVKAGGDTFPNTAPVGSFEPNFNGLYDMGGNAWEWVSDWYENPKSGRQTNRTLRGGSWQDSRQTNLLSSARTYDTHEVRNPAFGFRIVLTRASSR